MADHPNVEIVSAENEEIPRSGHRLAIIGDVLYVIGGYNPEANPPIRNEIKRYDLVRRQWLPEPSNGVTGTRSPSMASHCADTYGRFILVHGGSELPFGTCSQRALYAYDTRTHHWSHVDAELSDECSLPHGIYGHTMHVIDDYIYLIGGTSATEFYNSVYRFDLRAKVDETRWVTLFDEDEYGDPWERNQQAEEAVQDEQTPIGRYRHESVVFGQFIVMVGGGTAHGVFDINNIYFFDTVDHRWLKKRAHPIEPNAPAPLSRKCHSLNRIGQYIYIFGGRGEEFSSAFGGRVPVNFDDIWRVNINPLNVTENEFTPCDNFELVWEYVGRMQYPIHFHASAVHRGSNKVFIFGGNTMKRQARANQRRSVTARLISGTSLERTNKLSSFGELVHFNLVLGFIRLLIRNDTTIIKTLRICCLLQTSPFN